MTSLLTIEMSPWWLGTAQIQDRFGGKAIIIEFKPDVLSNLEWISKFRNELEQESRLRQQNPALASAWSEYQTMLKLVK